MAFTQGFISELVGKRVTIDELPIGKIGDFLVNHPEATFPQIDGFVVKTAQGARFAPMDSVLSIERGRGVSLSSAPKEPAPPEGEALYLVADLLDKQIVDIDGRKVVRINDLEVARTGGQLRVVAADIGFAGLLRRLGLRKLGERFSPALHDRIPRAMIAWDSVAPIRELNPSHVHLSVTASKLARLHPSDLAEIIGNLSSNEAATVVKQLDDEVAADAFEHLDAQTQRELIENVGTARAADIIEEMDSDDAADLLAELPEERQSELLAEMNADTAGELRELVKYDDDTAGGLMTTDYVWIYPHRSAEATIRKIREIAPTSEFIYYLYVLDERDTLLGVLTLRALLLAPPGAKIDHIMETHLVTVATETQARDVSATIARYDLLAVPVVDESGRMLGIVTVDDAIDAIMPEDLAKKLPHFTARYHNPAAAVAAPGS